MTNHAQQRTFLQVHLYFSRYLDEFYGANPELKNRSFAAQTDAIVEDGFSAIHMFGAYMGSAGYDSSLIVANSRTSQDAWMEEHRQTPIREANWVHEITRRQINALNPDILYLSDPVAFDSAFVRSLAVRPRLVVGWKASNIPDGTDWSEFDVMLSSLAALRATALKLGARSAEHFFPGYPTWINEHIKDIPKSFDVGFCGQWTESVHARRNQYLSAIAQASQASGDFSAAFYLSGELDTLTPEVAARFHGSRFGVPMHRALAGARILIDARGVLHSQDQTTGPVDLAARETANMRIFEVTGSGGFLLAEHHDNLAEYFELGTEIETFRDEIELVEKIRYYVAHPKQRDKIAAAGQARCLRDYSMSRRAEAFDRIIQSHISSTALLDKSA